MNDTFGFPEAARRLGVSLRILRLAIRTGKVPAPAQVSATTTLTSAWLESVRAAVVASPDAFSRASLQKVPAFARYPGTSAWQKFSRRVDEYAAFRAALD